MPANDTENNETPAADDRPGELLRAAREREGLSIEQVAEALHLDESIIAALEQNDFETLGAPVYVRGHISKYADLLGLPAEQLAEGIHSDTSGPLVAEALKRSGTMPATINPVLLISMAALILIGLLLAVYVALGAEQPAQPGPSSVTTGSAFGETGFE